MSNDALPENIYSLLNLLDGRPHRWRELPKELQQVVRPLGITEGRRKRLGPIKRESRLSGW